MPQHHADHPVVEGRHHQVLELLSAALSKDEESVGGLLDGRLQLLRVGIAAVLNKSCSHRRFGSVPLLLGPCPAGPPRHLSARSFPARPASCRAALLTLLVICRHKAKEGNSRDIVSFFAPPVTAGSLPSVADTGTSTTFATF